MRISERQLGAFESEIYGVQRGVRPLALLSCSAELEHVEVLRAHLARRFGRPQTPGAAPRREVRFTLVQAAPDRYSLVCFAVGASDRAARLIALLDGTQKKDTREIGLLLGYAPDLCV